jgi:hypothetical protein
MIYAEVFRTEGYPSYGEARKALVETIESVPYFKWARMWIRDDRHTLSDRVTIQNFLLGGR